MRRWIVMVVVGVGLVALGWFAHQFASSSSFFGSVRSDERSRQRSAVQAVPGGADGEDRVVALGWLEPAGGVINIGAPIGDRLDKLVVSEGTSVKKGQELAYLEVRSLRRIEMESIVSQISEAEARYGAESKLADARITEAGLAVQEADTLQLDIEAQNKKVEFLKASLHLASEDLIRLEGLSEKMASKQERARQSLLVRQAATELAAAQAALKKMNRAHQLSLDAARAKLDAARASRQQVLSSIPLESLKKNLQLAKTLWDRTVVVAPCDGTVLRVFMRSGEPIGRTPILQMANLKQMVAVAEVYETEIERVRTSKEVVITSRALPAPYNRTGLRGKKIVRIGQIVSRPGLQSIDPLARADRHAVEVRIELDKKASAAAANLINLQVDVTFQLGP